MGEENKNDKLTKIDKPTKIDEVLMPIKAIVDIHVEFNKLIIKAIETKNADEFNENYKKINEIYNNPKFKATKEEEELYSNVLKNGNDILKQENEISEKSGWEDFQKEEASREARDEQ